MSKKIILSFIPRKNILFYFFSKCVLDEVLCNIMGPSKLRAETDLRRNVLNLGATPVRNTDLVILLSEIHLVTQYHNVPIFVISS